MLCGDAQRCGQGPSGIWGDVIVHAPRMGAAMRVARPCAWRGRVRVGRRERDTCTDPRTSLLLMLCSSLCFECSLALERVNKTKSREERAPYLSYNPSSLRDCVYFRAFRV